MKSNFNNPSSQTLLILKIFNCWIHFNREFQENDQRRARQTLANYFENDMEEAVGGQQQQYNTGMMRNDCESKSYLSEEKVHS